MLAYFEKRSMAFAARGGRFFDLATTPKPDRPASSNFGALVYTS
jgi:hypothetical protein